MDSFTPLDTLRAFLAPVTSCFPWRRVDDDDTDVADTELHRDELEGLLADGDALSLRSEGGRGRGRAKEKRAKKGIRMCGLDLFGRRTADPHDDEDEYDDDFEQDRWLSRDASPLPPDAPSLTPSQISFLAATKFQPRHHRSRSREEDRDEALVRSSSMAFEGFPGSGSLAVAEAEDDAIEYGDFVQVPPRPDNAAASGSLRPGHSRAKSSARPTSSRTPSLASHARSKSRPAHVSPPSSADSVRTPLDPAFEGFIGSTVAAGNGFPSMGLSRAGGAKA